MAPYFAVLLVGIDMILYLLGTDARALGISFLGIIIPVLLALYCVPAGMCEPGGDEAKDAENHHS